MFFRIGGFHTESTYDHIFKFYGRWVGKYIAVLAIYDRVIKAARRPCNRQRPIAHRIHLDKATGFIIRWDHHKIARCINEWSEFIIIHRDNGNPVRIKSAQEMKPLFPRFFSLTHNHKLTLLKGLPHNHSVNEVNPLLLLVEPADVPDHRNWRIDGQT